VMCREDGGILDDLLVYRISDDEYMLVVNAANRSKDFEWMIQHNPHKADLIDASDEIALLAVQGPRSKDILEDRKSTRLNSSHVKISYAVFCLKKKKKNRKKT